MSNTEETIIIDPVGMNIVNRIAPGTKFKGTIECSGGLLVQGNFEGDVTVVNGPMVLMQEGVIKGNIKCDGDAFLFGKIEPKDSDEPSDLTAAGDVFMAQTLDAKANITAAGIRSYEGAQVDGRIRTVRKEKAAA